jgi:hypothetical protein
MTYITPITSPSHELAINTEPSAVARLPAITVEHAAAGAAQQARTAVSRIAINEVGILSLDMRFSCFTPM